jgi:protein-disulfide isomerase
VVVAAGVVVAVVVAISVSGGGSTPGVARGGARHALVTGVDAALRGIPEHGVVLGHPHAPATLTLYGDLQCPVCAALADGQDGSGLPRFIQDQVRPGHARIVFRSLCTATCNSFPESIFDEQQVAAYAAGGQNRFWYYEELFYRQQGAEGTPYVTEAFLKEIAHQIPGLSVAKWAKYRKDPTLLGEVQADGRAAIKQLPVLNGGRGTPGLIMTGSKGTRVVAEGVASYAQLTSAMKSVS